MDKRQLQRELQRERIFQAKAKIIWERKIKPKVNFTQQLGDFYQQVSELAKTLTADHEVIMNYITDMAVRAWENAYLTEEEE